MSSGGNDCDSNSKLHQIALADERWKMVRSAIEHEDNLINQRLSWLFAGHAFLFICFAMVQTTLLTKEVTFEPAITTELGLAVVLLCAAFIALITHRNITLANIHSNSLRQWWIDNYNPSEWHYMDRSVISSLFHFFTCSQRSEDFKQVSSSTQQELTSAESNAPTSLATCFPPIKGHFPQRRGSIAACVVVMDLALLAVCLGVTSQKFVDSMEVSSPRIIESRSNSENNSSQDAGGGGDSGGGGSRSTGALDIP